jgi:hypothetical protein
MRRISIFICAALLLSTSVPSAQDATRAVLERAGVYVTEFQRRLSGVVAEETYRQDVRDTQIGMRSSTRGGIRHRKLISDLLLVRPEGSDRWVQFRDVFDVDGKPVRDRTERLMKLFLQPTPSTAAQVEQIVAESARYNIGNVQRTINVPTLALVILEPSVQRRFAFTRVNPAAPEIGRDLALLDRAWVIRFEELKSKETIITTTAGRALPSHGRFWIEPATGRVLASELIAQDVALAGTIVVTYRADLLAGLLVPAAMRERYDERRTGVRISGSATYGKYRQFQVKVDERIAPIKQ